MKYYEISISTSEESRDAIINKLLEMGSTGFWDRDGQIVAYFEDQKDISFISGEITQFKKILEHSGLDSSFSFEYLLLSEENWDETWKKNFVPMDIGDNFTVTPSWLHAATTRIPIIIDPGMVFGTGHHETTKSCLILLYMYSQEGGKNGFLDVGTGTGMLAIAAAKLGFTHIIGVDTDPLAVDAAQRNVKLNSMDNILIKEGSISDVEGGFDMIAANLLSETLIAISAEIVSRLNPQGIAILSGMLLGQEEGVIEAMKNSGLKLKEKFIENKWVSLVFGV